MKIIGVGGTNGSGKDTLGEILAEDCGYLFVSVSNFLREEAKRRGLPIEREVLRTISAEWRRQYGLGVLVDKAVEQFKKSDGKYKGLVAIPMRNPGEAQRIKDLGGTLVWVDAEPKLRYQRIYSRQRSAEDQKTFEQFLAEEQAEMSHQGGDQATLNMAGVKAIADIFVTNNTDNLEDFKRTVKKSLNL
ncbi:MAG TPA: AAA family ATPase [Candidatus Saccharimonadales bacterium]|nr:AAA family ATPase [Candidatus Saccharimonadales bacterium]